ncbi:uncharacterized protein GGS22DRAFT_76351 [Annulohypoxylon maeteangense]|uniref:uncharacterized protein n=1 Tax=Annulohypoxylon maeteangense TaxID=1927788 RepID=UPI002008C252|nr:uncharacterized protein GGS22DRAFT_76351 [Annulohypoxylon maeteangense]KAI0881145.1 hypothetical protein GGS22DRAFT_76351 [Annulohypoxylon maeteangense]
MAKRSAPSVAYFEEEDDEGNLIGEPQYARSTAHSSPSKEKPNTGKSRKDSNRRASKDFKEFKDFKDFKDYKEFKEPKSPILSSLSDSDSSTELTRRVPKLKMKGDKKRREDPLVNQQRPAPRSRKTAPPPASRLSEESYYGINPQQSVSSIPARPRARTRPESYYGQRPPLSTSAYAHQPPPPSHLPPPSFPPVAPYWMGGPPPPTPMGHALVHQPIPSPSSYGEPLPPNRDLASRFGRPQSAMGFQPPPKALDYEPVKEKALTRRGSTARKISKDYDDRHRMPPPARPASTQPNPNRLVIRPTQSSHAAPPSQAASRRKSVGFTEGGFTEGELRGGDPSMYKAVTRREVEYGTGALPPRPRPQSYDTESIYDMGNYELEPATRGRRSSFYNFEEKVRDASRYQEDVSGGNAPPLTAEALRRVKNGGSSRSTRSTASRDESDYKQSATTRTTRSGSGDDDITIKLPMGAVIEVGNTKIHCKDGGNMNIGRGNGTSRAGGSDHAAPSNYSDERSERKSRADRSERRTRTGSYSRTRSTGPPLYPRTSPDYSHYDDYDDRYDVPQHAPYMGYYERERELEREDDDDDSYFDC